MIRADELAVKVATPTQAEIDDVIERQLPSVKADLRFGRLAALLKKAALGRWT